MSDDTTTSRVLRLLGLLQSRRAWTGTELADRLDTSARTVRRDIDRLRELGYRIAAERGAIGGYRLEAGADLPPLLFSADEAVALALALRSSAIDGAVRDVADLGVSVLAKLEQVLPAAVRERVQATQAAIVAPGPVAAVDLVEPTAFAALALACRDSEVVRFSYADAAGLVSDRRVEPTALVPLARHWYLLAWDTARVDWRTFRVDRITDVARTHSVVPRRAVPGKDAAAYVVEGLGAARSPLVVATVRVDAPFNVVEARLGPFTRGLAATGESTLWRMADENVEVLHGALAWLIWPFEIVEGEELRRFVTAFAARASSGAGGSPSRTARGTFAS
jgi:predicted DNA-binding transcriptional regulator YafY